MSLLVAPSLGRVSGGAIARALVAVLVAGGCGSPAPSSTPSLPSPTEAVTATSPAGSASPPAAGVRPVVVDTDLAADDILAIMVLLRDPSADVRGIAVDGTGEVRCPAGVRNARRLVAAFGRGDIPVACGRANPGPAGRWFPTAWRDGADAFYGIELPAVPDESTRTGEEAPALLARLAAEARSAGDPLTVVALGPWTNLADALAADPAFATNLAGIHAMGGTIDAPGNIDIETTSPADRVEWNFGVDPDALAAVLATDVPVAAVGLDATQHVPVPADIEQTLAQDTAAAGADIAREMYLRSPFLIPGSSFWDTLAAVLLTDPSIATWEDVPVRVETAGRSAGRTTRDPGGRTVHEAMTADKQRFMTAFLAGLRRGAPRPEPFSVAGTLVATWDGKRCTVTSTPTAAGDAVVTFKNQGSTDASVIIARAAAPHTWTEVMAWAQQLTDPYTVPPAWIVGVGNASAGAGATGTSVATFEPGSYGAACVVTEPKLDVTDGGAFEVKG